MIFVTIGTCEPFDRLMRAVDALRTDEELVVQTGLSTVVPAHATTMSFMPYDRLVELVRDARLVVTHAGVGTILTALLNGVKPIVVPRLREFGDAVDDHQLELAERLESLDLVYVVRDEEGLAAAIGAGLDTSRSIRVGAALVGELREYIALNTA